MMQQTLKNNKGLIVIFIAVFTLPVLLAKFALEYHWFNEASTNKGELLNPVLDLGQLNEVHDEAKWKFLYILPAHCDDPCENAIYSLKQLWSALGKEQDRVESVVLAKDDSDNLALAKLAEYKQLRIIKTSTQSVDTVFKEVKTNGIFIVDTLNNIILRYPTQSDPKQAVLHSRDILSDMRKVLKLSRIG